MTLAGRRRAARYSFLTSPEVNLTRVPRRWFESTTEDPNIRFANRSRWGGEALVLNLPEPGFPAQEAVAAIRMFITEHSDRPTAESWTAAGKRPCEKTIRRLLGSFRVAATVAAARQDDYPGVVAPKNSSA